MKNRDAEMERGASRGRIECISSIGCHTPMRPIFLAALFFLALAAALTAQTCREVVRDSFGRIVQAISRQTSPSGTVQSVTRDGSGRCWMQVRMTRRSDSK